ncbi:MAG: helix-turn-helix domain-containing protein [Burkholderia sp.]
MRSLPREEREERRRQMISLRTLGWTYNEIVKHTNLSRTGVCEICKRYAREGAAGLRDKPSGGAVNPYRALSEQQEVEIRARFMQQRQSTPLFELVERDADFSRNTALLHKSSEIR